jgi:hypothetical protein
MKEITDTELLIIRHLKRNNSNDKILKRLVGRYYALYPEHVERDEIFHCLFDIIEKFDLLYYTEKGKDIRNFFIYKDSFMDDDIDMLDMWIQKAKSRIRLSEVAKFPRYPKPARSRNRDKN